MSPGARPPRCPRVLVIGQDPQVLALVAEEVEAGGTPVTGIMADSADTVLDEVFDIVAFGAGVTPEQRASIEKPLLESNPETRFLRTYAPYAASTILAAAGPEPAAPAVDLAAYVARIGYEGPLEPSLDVLRALQARHLAAIPFEAIDVLLGRGVDLAPAAVDRKLVASRRGGYCYEQNGLFKRVLEAIGFEVDGLLASVRWMAAPGAPPPPRTHMVLRVRIDGGLWLVDVGFGSSVPPAPLRLGSREPQATPHETYRILPFGAGLLLQAEIGGRWQSLYDLSPEPVLDSHYELFNWFTSTHPSSHFRQQLIVARTTPDRRYALLQNRLTIRSADGSFERRRLDAEAMRAALTDLFGLSVEPEWSALVDRFAADDPAAPPRAKPHGPEIQSKAS